MSKTHWKKLTNPDYLGTYALEPDKDLIVTIKEVDVEQVFNPSKNEKESCTVIRFKEDVKPLIANATNQKIIQKIYGTPYIEDWKGKQIQLYIKDDIKAFGEVTTGLRIRRLVPQKKKEELTPSHKKWGAAVKNVAEGTTTIKDIRKHYVLDEESKELLMDDVEDYNQSKENE